MRERWRAKFNQDEAARRKEREEAGLLAGVKVMETALGKDGVPGDPVAARRMLLAAEDLDERVKVLGLKAITAGTLNKRDDPVHVAELTARLAAARGDVSDGELLVGMITGQMCHATTEKLVKLRERMRGPDAAVIAAAYARLDAALGGVAWGADKNVARPGAKGVAEVAGNRAAGKIATGAADARPPSAGEPATGGENAAVNQGQTAQIQPQTQFKEIYTSQGQPQAQKPPAHAQAGADTTKNQARDWRLAHTKYDLMQAMGGRIVNTEDSIKLLLCWPQTTLIICQPNWLGCLRLKRPRPGHLGLEKANARTKRPLAR